jgi:hypothetical protein
MFHLLVGVSISEEQSWRQMQHAEAVSTRSREPSLALRMTRCPKMFSDCGQFRLDS